MRLYHQRLMPNANFENRTFIGFDPNARALTQMPFAGYQGVILASGTWTPPVDGTYEINCVGGGGGGRSYYGAPGGAGFWATGNFSLSSSTAYSVTIGGAGARATAFGTASTGGTTSFSTLLTAAGGTGGGDFTGGSGGSGGGGAMNSGGQGGGPAGYDGSNGGIGNTGGAAGTGQLGVAWSLGTNQRIPGGGAGGFINGSQAHPSSGYGGRYRGIYGFGVGRGGGYGDPAGMSGWKYATGRGCAGGSGNWYNGSAGDGAAGMIVWRLVG